MNAKIVISTVLFSLTLCCLTGLAQAQSTKDDPSVTPWNDLKDPSIIRLNKNDPSLGKMMDRNDKQDRNIRGPIDLQRYAAVSGINGFPTYMVCPLH